MAAISACYTVDIHFDLRASFYLLTYVPSAYRPRPDVAGSNASSPTNNSAADADHATHPTREP